MKKVIAAKRPTACVNDRVRVSHPDETAVAYINYNEGGEGYEGWVATIAFEDGAQEDCGLLEMPNGEFIAYADNITDLSIVLQVQARRLRFRYVQIIELTDDPVQYDVTEL